MTTPNLVPLEPLPLDGTNLQPEALARFLAGEGSFLLLPPDDASNLGTIMRLGEPIHAGTIIACTSGSTGTPKGAMLGVEQIRASISATADRIGTGAWLLALPPHHIAGFMVLMRGHAAGCEPTISSHLLNGTRFTPEDFARDTRTLQHNNPGRELFTSLVPTQLRRLLDTPAPETIEALRTYTAILVGGAAADPHDIDTARALGAQIVRTYGSSETSGGVIYEGAPLPGVRVSASSDGRIVLTGTMVARGYRNHTDATPFSDNDDGTRNFLTSDLGEFTDGHLTLRGRADGAINSGGYKVLPEEVERSIAPLLAELGLPPRSELCVVAIAHPELGEQVALAVEAAPARDHTDQLRTAARGRLPRHLIPRITRTLPEFPRTALGKIDRQAIARRLAESN